ncbi:hypothetical protein BV898_12713 [Hypsibius exemplaris]|uniref:Uncharacterized protein n=1 Tax=Hypsibius exemplaris TaxID=2072580 RepID=A0A1W0WCW1_HYPEX|nr:hypothetical protein BV898_12713 [Hypsibius exemplaris]
MGSEGEKEEMTRDKIRAGREVHRHSPSTDDFNAPLSLYKTDSGGNGPRVLIEADHDRGIFRLDIWVQRRALTKTLDEPPETIHDFEDLLRIVRPTTDGGQRLKFGVTVMDFDHQNTPLLNLEIKKRQTPKALQSFGARMNITNVADIYESLVTYTYITDDIERGINERTSGNCGWKWTTQETERALSAGVRDKLQRGGLPPLLDFPMAKNILTHPTRENVDLRTFMGPFYDRNKRTKLTGWDRLAATGSRLDKPNAPPPAAPPH